MAMCGISTTVTMPVSATIVKEDASVESCKVLYAYIEEEKGDATQAK